jgi:hypothetical protein
MILTILETGIRASAIDVNGNPGSGKAGKTLLFTPTLYRQFFGW